MTEASKSPKKRRRRWLIVCVVLVLVSTVSWWYWPRGDARFVGTWSLHRSHGLPSTAILTLRANGNGSIHYADLSRAPRNFRWRAKDNTIVMGGHPSLGPMTWWSAIAKGYRTVTGSTWQLVPLTVTVVGVSHDEIELDASRIGSSLNAESLRRIPE